MDEDDLDHFAPPSPMSSSHNTAQSTPERESAPQPPAKKLCVRHQRMADEGTNLKLQQVSAPSPLISVAQPTHPGVSEGA